MTLVMDRSLNSVQPEFALHDNIAARAKALREGKPMPELDPVFTCPDALATVIVSRTHKPAEAPIPLPPKREFTSRKDAKRMNRVDRCNVQPLRRSDAEYILSRLEESHPALAEKLKQEIERKWVGILTVNERFTLTAMAARKYLATKAK